MHDDTKNGCVADYDVACESIRFFRLKFLVSPAAIGLTAPKVTTGGREGLTKEEALNLGSNVTFNCDRLFTFAPSKPRLFFASGLCPGLAL